MACALFAGLLPPQGVSAQAAAPAVLDELGHGGYVILFRHAATTGKDEKAFALSDCAAQQALSEAGRAQARGIGEAFKSRKIPVGKVMASGYCRTLETARLAFGAAEASDALLRPKFEPAAGMPAPPPWPQRLQMLNELVAAAPAAPANTILITHGESIEAIAKTQVGYAGAVIMKPDGHGAAAQVAAIRAEDWSAP